MLAVKRYASRNPGKRAAHAAVSKALRAGLLIRPAICDMAEHGECQGRIEAHPPDYARPLDVQWLCARHHHELRLKPAVYHPPTPYLLELRVQPHGN